MVHLDLDFSTESMSPPMARSGQLHLAIVVELSTLTLIAIEELSVFHQGLPQLGIWDAPLNMSRQPLGQDPEGLTLTQTV